MKKNIAPRITPECRAYLVENFKNANSGAEYTLESANVLYRQTLIGIKGRFSDNELKLMIDAMNATMLKTQMTHIAGKQLTGNVWAGMALDSLDEKWDVDADALNQKLAGCHLFETHCLEIWTNGFWYGGDVSKQLDVDKYIKPLL